jgi:hypothetical protein
MAKYQIHVPNCIPSACVYTSAGCTYFSRKRPFTKVNAGVKSKIKAHTKLKEVRHKEQLFLIAAKFLNYSKHLRASTFGR